MGDWIPVSLRMPEEHSVCENGWFEGRSDWYYVTIEEADGRRTTTKGRTVDGEWETHFWAEANVVAWMPYPEPYMEDKR